MVLHPYRHTGSHGALGCAKQPKGRKSSSMIIPRTRVDALSTVT